ncbi:MAG: malonyl-CoA decarboxylase [Betaproteobacteria bacterium]|nr:malonyl-CoA decarboxylase [Betaproteobacteria bacterium]
MKSPAFIKRFFAPAAITGSKADRHTRKTVALCHALLSERGEASGAALAREALESYGMLSGPALTAFFDVLAREFSPDPEAVETAAGAYRQDASQANLIRLQQAVESPRQELFRRLNLAAGGTAALVEMRRRVLHELRTQPKWAGIDADLAHLLGSWFNRGFLSLQRIDWRTPALVLEKLMQYEAVHEIQGWRDLRRRLESDRRCFAFFHPALPDEPIIFIEVALTKGMSDQVQPLIDPDSPVVDPAGADTAVFYSITNCQEGLRGISFGNFLIKQVAQDLGREFPRLKTFATLSPIPGFRRWLAGTAAAHAELAELAGALEAEDWFQRAAPGARARTELMRLCAYYLQRAKHGTEPADPVARFHLSNGARMERLNWLADTSKPGMAHSAGLMVNYVYRLKDVERNHETYAKEHLVVASPGLSLLARGSLLARLEARRQG